MLSAIKNFIERDKCRNLTDKFFDQLRERKLANMEATLRTITNFLVDDHLKRTGILYSPYDSFIQTEAQRLFWEWKREGIINEFENFDEFTWNWIKVYA